MKAWRILVLLGLISDVGIAADIPQGGSMPGDRVVPSGQGRSEYLPGDAVIPKIDETPGLRAKVDAAAQIIQEAREAAVRQVLEQQVPRGEGVGHTEGVTVLIPPVEPPIATPVVPKLARKRQSIYRDDPSGVRIFSRGLERKSPDRDYHSLPATSFALATLLHGIETTPSGDDVVAELDYAWLGPNGAVVEMTGCRLWLNVKANYSTSRLNGESRSMTCMAPRGEIFEIPIDAKIIDGATEYAGAAGDLVAHGKGIAAALGFLQNGVSEWGKATAGAQVSTATTTGANSPTVTSSNVTGDEYRYIVGRSVAASTAQFLDWWIEFYKGLTPTIAVGPGKKVYLVVRKGVEIPKIFFGKVISNTELRKVNEGIRSRLDEHSVNTGTQLPQQRKDGSTP